ncbi:MAG: endolytic transglycosylase MltG [Proteobacteria bacterium]|nr:endolytic transglycosylase MltG [Pseudomonadota bacterium]
MKKAGCLGLLAALALLVGGWALAGTWFARGPLKHDTVFVVPDGATLGEVAQKLEDKGAVLSARTFRWRARMFGHGQRVKAGEFMLPLGASESKILSILAGDEALRRFVTVPEGLPSVMVQERLMAQGVLEGSVEVPDEGSVLPNTYDIKRGETRQAVLARMQAAMTKALAEEWAGREDGLVISTPQEALTLASIVEKETAKPEERPMVAGLYSNRLRKGIMLQADPTIIYPITKGKPLGRRIHQSEIAAVNGYNTYAMTGLPKGPITNPGRAAIHAVLHPAKTDVLYMVADGKGGHAFATTLEQHNENVQKWFAIRRAKGDM